MIDHSNFEVPPLKAVMVVLFCKGFVIVAGTPLIWIQVPVPAPGEFPDIVAVVVPEGRH